MKTVYVHYSIDPTKGLPYQLAHINECVTIGKSLQAYINSNDLNNAISDNPNVTHVMVYDSRFPRRGVSVDKFIERGYAKKLLS